MTGGRREMNRLYAVEPTPTTDRLGRRPPPAAAVRRRSASSPWRLAAARRRAPARRAGVVDPDAAAWVAPLAQGPPAAPGREPRHRRRRAAGRRARARARDQPGARQRRRDGRSYTDPVEAAPADQLASLARRWPPTWTPARSRRCVILGGNPVYTAPADLDVRRAPAAKVAAARPPRPLRRRDRGALPLARPRGALPRVVERRARLRRHRHDRPAADRAALRRHGRRTRCSARCCRKQAGQSRLRHRPRLLAAAQRPAGRRDFETFWRKALHDGVVAGHGGSPRSRRPRRPRGRRRHPPPRGAGPRDRLPRPTRRSTTAASPTTAGCRNCRSRITKLTWDNAALHQPGDGASGSASPTERRRRARATAAARCRRRSGSCPATPPAAITVHLGYGRTRAGRVGQRRRLQRLRAPHDRGALGRPRRLGLRKTGERYPLAAHAAPPDDGGPRRSCGRPRSTSSSKNPDFAHDRRRGARRGR